MATVTNRLRLGTATALVVEWDPIHLAKEIATPGLLSDSRAELGIGAGWRVVRYADGWHPHR